jgi:flagellar biosynthesis regulator FlaF
MIMYQFPYSSIFEEPSAPTPSRNCLISNAIELFEASGGSSFQPFERLQLLSDFRRLWLAIADDLHHASEELPEAHKIRFPAAMHSVLQEIERRRFRSPALAAAEQQMRPERLS